MKSAEGAAGVARIGCQRFLQRGDRQVKNAIGQHRCARDPGRLMLLDAPLPQEFAGIGVERIGIATLIAEIGRCATRVLADGNRRAHAESCLEHPALAAGFCIKGIDLAAGTADEHPAAKNGRLRVGPDVARESERPFQLQARNIVRRKLGLVCGLEAMLADVDTPTVPVRQGRFAQRRCRLTAARIRQHRRRRRWTSCQEPHDVADLASTQIPTLLTHYSIGQREAGPLRRELTQGIPVRRARHPALMAGGATLPIERFARRGSRLLGMGWRGRGGENESDRKRQGRKDRTRGYPRGRPLVLPEEERSSPVLDLTELASHPKCFLKKSVARPQASSAAWRSCTDRRCSLPKPWSAS